MRTIAAVLFILLPISAFAQNAPTLLEQYNDWEAYRFDGSGQKTCYILSKPKTLAPSNRNHGDVFFFLTSRPADDVTNEASVLVGYPFAPDSTVTVDIDGQAFSLFTKDDGAWVESPADEAQLVAAMRWYITAIPEARPELWVRARDLIFDWLEAEANELRIVPNLAVLGPPERDRRWKFSPYVRGVYLSGKALFVLEHPDQAGTMAAELAGVDAMLAFHEVTRTSDPMGTSPKLRRYARKKRKGSLEAHLQRRIAKGKQ